MAKTENGLGKKESSLMFKEISPPHRWDQDLDFHYLRLTLPGFTSTDMNLHIDKYGHLVMRGCREVSQNKYLTFEETFDIPESVDLEHVEGFFEDDRTYCVTIPKKKKLGKRSGGGTSKGVKLENQVDPNLPSSCPWPIINIDKSEKEIAFLIVILIAICVAWLSRGDNK